MQSIDKDKQILHLIRDAGRSNEGLKLMMDAYQERLYWHVRRIVHSHEDTDDVLQDTFIKAFQNIRKFKGASGLYTWLYRIATNESLTLLKKKKRMIMEDPEKVGMELFGTLRAEDGFSGDEIESRLHNAIAMLPQKQKIVFQMRYFDDLTYKEISEILETSVGGLKALFHHAVKKIEKYVLEPKI